MANTSGSERKRKPPLVPHPCLQCLPRLQCLPNGVSEYIVSYTFPVDICLGILRQLVQLMLVACCSYLQYSPPSPRKKINKPQQQVTANRGKRGRVSTCRLFTPHRNHFSILMAALISSAQNSRHKKLFININYEANTPCTPPRPSPLAHWGSQFASVLGGNMLEWSECINFTWHKLWPIYLLNVDGAYRYGDVMAGIACVQLATES